MTPAGLTAAWCAAVLWRAVRWDRRRSTSLPTQATGACAAFVLTVLPGATAAVHESGWIAALALNVAWLGGPGYYGTAAPLGRRLARLALPLATIAITANLVTAAIYTQPHATMVRALIVHALILGLAVGGAARAGAGARVSRGRPRASLVLLALGAASTAEAALINVQNAAVQNAAGYSPPAPTVTVALHTFAELAFLAGLLLPLAPRHQRSRHLVNNSHTLESLWRLLAGQAALRIDDDADLGAWTSDAVIAIRDRFAELQQRCPRTEFELAFHHARRDRHRRQTARAIAAAHCLHLALRAEAAEHPRVKDPVNLLGMGGGRWLDHEVAWLTAVHRELCRLLAPHPHTTTTVHPGPSLWADRQLVEQCQARLSAWFPGPLPATISAIRAAIAHRRDRAIGVTLSDNLPSRALVAAVTDVDLVFLSRQDTHLMRIVNEAHELAHLICGHTGTPLTAGSVRCRCSPAGTAGSWTDDPIEAEAEIIGRLIARHLIHAPGAGLASYLEER